MSRRYRFPLVLTLLFFAANFLVCRLMHKENTEGVFRMDDSVIRYMDALEASETGESTSKPSFSNHGLL
ncbi:hypothetical protein [Leptospira perdikensis]|uniref:Uncharacterized protein n=1 Tax=Leptospira perdikensis TaxID=2484948 RepID=A0A4R9JKD7_9LEPT|nr:hypothetical protein [Leptospira perdikensis]TGL45950.1 hypothetical protein EHQ49_00760 [Leptospira perdikensis]